MIAAWVKRLSNGESLLTAEARELMDLVMTGRLTTADIVSILAALKVKGETVDEIVGFAQSLRSHMVPVPGLNGQAVDGCGTGGDGAGTFNISTAASLVAAAAGAKVAKHGNRSVSSRSGSADILEAAGAVLEQTPQQIVRSVNDLGFAFLFAPRFHPAMKHAAPARKELGTRTVFNILGPLCNPAGVRRQVIGVFSQALMEPIAKVLERLGTDHALIVHAEDGLDELSVSGPTRMVELRGGKISKFEVEPESIIGRRFPSGAVAGSGPGENVAILTALLDGERSAYSEAVSLNAAAMLYVAGRAESLPEGYQASQEALQSGRAADLFSRWIEMTRTVE